MKEERLVEFEISFPGALEKVENMKALFNSFRSLVNESEEPLLGKIVTDKRGKQMILESDEFMFIISFRQTPMLSIVILNPDKNIKTVNEVGNQVINFMNTILGEGATGSKVISVKTISHPERMSNFCRKIISDVKIAKINKIVKQTLNPIGIFFEYKSGEKEFKFLTFSNKRTRSLLFSQTTYKDKIPFDLIVKEYEELEKPTEIINKLIEAEL